VDPGSFGEIGTFATGKAAVLTGRAFRAGLHIAFALSIACCPIAAWASWSRGAKFAAVEPELMPAAEEVT
jgi:hypothetical protein